MVEGDAEDLWHSCLQRAMEMHGVWEGKRPRNLNILQVRRLARSLYDDCREITGEKVKEQRKLAPVVQLKQ